MSSPIRSNNSSPLPNLPATPPKMVRPELCSPSKRKVASILNYSPSPQSLRVSVIAEQSIPSFPEIISPSRFLSSSSASTEKTDISSFTPTRVLSDQQYDSPLDDSAFSSISILRRSLSLDSNSSELASTPIRRRPLLPILHSTPVVAEGDLSGSEAPSTPPFSSRQQRFFTPPRFSSPRTDFQSEDHGTPPPASDAIKQKLYGATILNAPVKIARGKALSEFEKKALTAIDTSTIKTNLGDFAIVPCSGKKGNYSQIYTIAPNQPALIDRVANEDILVKMFQKETFQQKGNLIEREFTPNMLRQYNELRQAGLRIVTIYNATTALKDGYFLVENLRSFKLPWQRLSSQEDIAEHQTTLDQLSVFIRYALESESDLPLDLSEANFCLDRNGNITLIDFREEKEEASVKYPFHLVAKAAFRNLSNGTAQREGNPYVYTHFKNLAKAYPDLYSEL